MARPNKPPKGGYPPESFNVPGQDTSGNSVRLYCRVVPLLDRAVDIILGTKSFPFKTKGDLMRWCIKRGVEELEQLEPVLGDTLRQVDIMMSILRDEEHNHAFMTVFSTMERTIAMHIQAQALGEARRVVVMIRGEIEKMSSGYWRERYMRELKNKFGHLLNSSTPNLGDTKDYGPEGGIDEDDE